MIPDSPLSPLDLAPILADDVRAMAAEIERMRKLVGACRELIARTMHIQFAIAMANDNGDSTLTVAHRLGQALDLIDAAQGLPGGPTP